VAAPIFAAETPNAAGKTPYVLITTDGHRIDAMEKPVVEAGSAKIHLSPTGQLTLYPAKMIDWPATEKFNAPPPEPMTRPAASAAPALTPPITETAGVTVSKDGKVVELKLIGGGHPTATVSGEPPQGGEKPGTPAEGASPGRPADPNAAAGVIAALAREYSDLRRVHEENVASRSKLEAEIADLEAKSANAAPSGLNYSETPTQKAIAQARASLQAVNDQISRLDTRMNEVRARAIDLGGNLE